MRVSTSLMHPPRATPGHRAGRRRRHADEQHGELITVAKYWGRWSDHRLIVCVFNNEDLNQVTWEQRVMEGDPKFAASQDIPNVPYHRFAELIGLQGVYLDNPDALAGAWEEALHASRPVVLEVKTDPEVPPLPPHVTLKQALLFSKTLLKG